MRRALRTLWVSTLDRQMAESEAIGRALRAGARSVDIRSSERITDPITGQGVWEIVVSCGTRTRRSDEGRARARRPLIR